MQKMQKIPLIPHISRLHRGLPLTQLSAAQQRAMQTGGAAAGGMAVAAATTAFHLGDRVTVELATKETKGSAIGQSTWTAAVLLSRELVSRAQALRVAPPDGGQTVQKQDPWGVRGKSCLELGCGTGLAGLTAIALDCQSCTFTDCSLPALCDLRLSLALLSNDARPKAHIRRHVWESDSPDSVGKPVRHWSNADTCDDVLFRPSPLDDDSVFDCILAADVLYFESQVQPLVHTLQRRLGKAGIALFLITVRARTTATVRRFEEALALAGFTVSSSDTQLADQDLWYLSPQLQVAQDFPAHYKQIFKNAARPQAATTAEAKHAGMHPIGHELALSVTSSERAHESASEVASSGSTSENKEDCQLIENTGPPSPPSPPSPPPGPYDGAEAQSLGPGTKAEGRDEDLAHVKLVLNEDGEEEFVLDLDVQSGDQHAAPPMQRGAAVCFTQNEVMWRLVEIRRA